MTEPDWLILVDKRYRPKTVYNLLWWEGRLWVIDVPQAVDLHASVNGYDLLHRDIVNVCAWFARKGIAEAADPDAVLGQVL